MSCHQQLIETVYFNQSHGGFTFSDSFNTPNVKVTGGISVGGEWVVMKPFITLKHFDLTTL